MSKRFFKISIFFISIILTQSCSKEETIESNGYVNKNNSIYNLNYGYIENLRDDNFNFFKIFLSDKPIEFKNGQRLVADDREVLIDLFFMKPLSQTYEGFYPLVIEDGTILNDQLHLTGSAITFGITPNTTDENISSNFEERNFIWNNGSAIITTNNGHFNINFSLENNDYLIEGEFNENLIDVSSN